MAYRPAFRAFSRSLSFFRQLPSSSYFSYSTAAAAELPLAASSPIQILRTKAEVRHWRAAQTLAGNSVGFVPTMGALHEGHLSLVRSSLRMNDKTLVSIFVNPSQFAPTEDLASYPRDFDRDVALLSELEYTPAETPKRIAAPEANVDESVLRTTTKVDAVFAPSVEEMYPSGIPLAVSEQTGAFVTVEGLSSQLEGAIRPQFFRGVATVVTKFLNIVQPDRVYFGQKDVQQTVVVKRMVSDLCYGCAVVVVPTSRADNGLALSSRNAYLTDQVREDAGAIFKGLQRAVDVYRTETDAGKIIAAVVETVAEKIPVEEIEYVCINDLETLEELERVHPLKGAILSLAVRVPNSFGGKTRLIDNVIL
ncbi:pantothenate synthase [Myxozyma melibiosi]|uniref:Pantoate--beta-alanine ligase n=1 Tax=Myxozyma melibiosi TaxID=54550 RepID=A0ABR1FA73_9ASCO